MSRLLLQQTEETVAYIRSITGQQQIFYTQACHNPHRIRNFFHAIAFIIMQSSLHAYHFFAIQQRISCITNMAAGILDQPLTEEEVLLTGEKSGSSNRKSARRNPLH